MDLLDGDVQRTWMSALFSGDLAQLDGLGLDISETLYNRVVKGEFKKKDDLSSVEQCLITLLSQRMQQRGIEGVASAVQFSNFAAAVAATLIDIETTGITAGLQTCDDAWSMVYFVMTFFLRDSLDYWLDALLQSSPVNTELGGRIADKIWSMCSASSSHAISTYIKLLVLCRKFGANERFSQNFALLKFPSSLRDWLRDWPIVPKEVVDGKRTKMVKWLLDAPQVDQQQLDAFLDSVASSTSIASRSTEVHDDSVVATTASTSSSTVGGSTSVVATESSTNIADEQLEQELFMIDTKPEIQTTTADDADNVFDTNMEEKATRRRTRSSININEKETAAAVKTVDDPVVIGTTNEPLDYESDAVMDENEEATPPLKMRLRTRTKPIAPSEPLERSGSVDVTNKEKKRDAKTNAKKKKAKTR